MLKIIKLKHLVLVKRKQNKNTYFKNKTTNIFSTFMKQKYLKKNFIKIINMKHRNSIRCLTLKLIKQK